MSASLQELRNKYREHRTLLFDALTRPDQVSALLRAHALAVDDTLIQQWHKHGLNRQPVALMAVGGYGRGELYPFSDVDILLLHQAPDEAALRKIEGIDVFLSEAWDLGFEIGHSVRSVAECLIEAEADVTVATSLLERRVIVDFQPLGAKESICETLSASWNTSFDVSRFVKAKCFEQQQRHSRFEDTAYNLEPNIKESPGGLRDAQMVIWLAHAMDGTRDFAALSAQGLLTEPECLRLTHAHDEIKFLRARLHMVAGRREDRLVFELQNTLATALGLVASSELRASEVLMKQYYQSARLVRGFNDILVDALTSSRSAPLTALPGAAPFAEREGKLEIELPDHAMSAFEVLSAFRLLFADRTYSGFTPNLRRAILRAAHALPSSEFETPACRAEMLSFIQAGHGIYHAVKLMSELDVMGKVLPPWQRIVGQMQHDLFHVYTVDQHILMVLRNMRRFTDPVHSHEYPLCSELIQDFKEREVLYLACLFHDIAKGRGGDHSALGMIDASIYCKALGLPDDHVELVAWLVEKHLTMSSFTQKRDITDPAVVREFADLVGNEKRLVALYLLTVADIRGTSPKVWNNWKARLLEQLFQATRRVFSAEGDATIFDLLAERMLEARRLLALYAVDVDKAAELWRTLDSVYLQRHSADEIAWHGRNLFFRIDAVNAVVRTRLVAASEGLQVMIYVADQPELFARIVTVFAKLGFSVLDARVHTSKTGYALDTFTVIHPGSAVAAYRDVTQLLEHSLSEALSVENQTKPLMMPPLGKPTRQQRHFPIAPRISITADDPGAQGQHFVLEILASDRTGLLARISQVLSARGISIQTARVNTLGARAEDVFVIAGGRLAEESTRIELETELAETIE